MTYPDRAMDLHEIVAAQASEDARADFIRKTYTHLTGAIFAFVALLTLLVGSPIGETIARTMLSGSWLIVLGAFMIVAYVADSWARSARSVGMQYAGLGLYVVAEAIIFTPLVYIAAYHQPGAIAPAAITTLTVFAGLTAYVFISKSDFSWVGGALTILGFVALGAIVCSILFGFELGIIFSSLMVGLAAGYILYSTSNVLHHYPIGSHVAAALALFAAVALMFWYVLQIFMSRD